MQWAFMTANYVGRALGYANNTDWMANHRATVEAFHGPQFGARFAEMIDDITAAGFDAIELWVAHLDPLLATPEMIAAANQILRERGVKLISYTAGFGQPGVTREDATRIFETAKAIGAPVFAQGFHPANGSLVAELGERYSIRMGLENHPHKTAQEVIDIVAPFAPWVGSANDTGWFATQGYDAVRATYELRDYLVHVHLKDITVVGGHETCALGDGVVDIPGVLKALKEIGYTGAVTIEHEPYDHDPTAACALSLKRAAAWWAELEGAAE
ncbi:MAG: sugar phosphate isomerase/epimerase [Roseiflexaceae bacterium]